MSQRMNIGDMQRAAGILTWAIVTGVVTYIAVRWGERYTVALPLVSVLALINVAAMWLVMSDDRPVVTWRRAALWVQLASALAMGWLLPIGFMPIYTIIWIAMATWYYSLRVCWWLLAAVLVAWLLIMSFVWRDDDAVITVVLYGTFHLFALLTARNASEAQSARDKVEMLNRELVATQHLLAEASRQGERTRIARDLHDLLGHHLTALSINLQIAERMASGETKAKVEECRALARLLLSDVREAVSELRDESAVDFTRAIALVADNAPELDIDVDIEEGLTIDNVDVAETLLRCIQEAITNTLRHAGARRSWISLRKVGDNIHLEVRDDGRVGDELAEGNGFAGMRERLAQIHGSLKLDTFEDALRLRVDIPVPG